MTGRRRAMNESPRCPRRPRVFRSGFGFMAGAALGAIAAAPLAWYLRGFTVDDALIPARYAHHLARGFGYRFNPQGPSSDGVTPLGFAHLLAPFAEASVLGAWEASRWLGRALWLLAAAALGAGVSAVRSDATGDPSPRRYVVLLLVLCSAPLGAWASAGLETPWVVACATGASVLAVRPSRATLGAGLAGLCAWWRPEMLLFAAVLAIARAKTAPTRGVRVACVALGVGPWLLAASVRALTWGRPAPLALFAKPSDLAHGLRYVLPAIVFAGAPLVALAPLSWARLAPWPRALVVAGFGHLAVVALAGGDWMPLARLVCPALPPLVLVGAHLLSAEQARRWAVGRLIIGCAGQIAVLVLRGESAQRVSADRLALIRAARPLLANVERVATVDVGWVGAATGAEVIDLAGATDQEIALLSGGHTSKAVSGAFLTARRPDVLLFAIDPGDADRARHRIAGNQESAASEALSYTRVVERRLAADTLIARHFAVTWVSPPTLPLVYVGLARRQESVPPDRR